MTSVGFLCIERFARNIFAGRLKVGRMGRSVFTMDFFSDRFFGALAVLLYAR